MPTKKAIRASCEEEEEEEEVGLRSYLATEIAHLHRDL